MAERPHRVKGCPYRNPSAYVLEIAMGWRVDGEVREQAARYAKRLTDLYPSEPAYRELAAALRLGLDASR